MRPVWLAAAVAVGAFLVARRRRLEPTALIGGALLALGLAIYGAGLVELPRLDDLLEDVGRTLGPWTYALVGALAFLEAGAFLGLLVPGETATIVGGVVAGQGEIDIVVLIALVWAAAFTGDLTGFWLGTRLGRSFLIRHGPRFGFTAGRLGQVDRFFDRHGGKAVFLGRFVGIVRSLAPFLAGSSRMPLGRFVAYDILGSGIQVTLLCLAGYLFWHSIDTVLGVARQGALALGTTIVVVSAAVVAARWLRVPEHRRRVRGWLAQREHRLVVRVLLAVLRRAERPVRFLYNRITPGQLGLELTTLLAIASVAGFVFVAYLVTLDGTQLTPGDRRAALWSDDLRSTPLDDVASTITQLGSLPVVVAALVPVAAWLIVKHQRLEGISLVGGLGLTAVSVELVKSIVDRPPLPHDTIVEVSSVAYPSAQAAYAVSWVAIAVAFRRALPGIAHRAALLGVAIVATATIGLSRVYLHADWFSDVAGGTGLGALCLSLSGIAALVIVYVRPRPPQRQTAPAGVEGTPTSPPTLPATARSNRHRRQPD